MAFLDIPPPGCDDRFDGESVCGCIEVDLGRSEMISSFRIHAQLVDDGCGLSPCHDEDGVCNTGHTFESFTRAGPNAAYEWAEIIVMPTNETDILRWYEVEVNRQVQFITACRAPWGSHRSDIGVDAIEAICL